MRKILKIILLNLLFLGVSILHAEVLISPNGYFSFVQVKDGNFAIVFNPTLEEIWSTDANRAKDSQLTFMSNGDLVLKDKKGKILWNTFTDQYPEAKIKMQNDGNLVITDPSLKAVWSTQTVKDAESIVNFWLSTETKCPKCKKKFIPSAPSADIMLPNGHNETVSTFIANASPRIELMGQDITIEGNLEVAKEIRKFSSKIKCPHCDNVFPNITD